jgi:hypothetical protein
MIFLFSGRNARATALWIGIGLSGFAAFADQVSKAETTVPTVTYRSVFRETSLGIEQEKLDWRKANDDVGKFTRGHVDILKQEEMEGKAMDKKAMDAKAMDEKKTMDSKPMPAKPVAPAAPAPHKH